MRTLFVLCSFAAVGLAQTDQTTLIRETFANGLPSYFSVPAGSYTVANGSLSLTSGCLVLAQPNGNALFSRSQGLRIEVDVRITNPSNGDFNVYAFYGGLSNCAAGPTNGYNVGWHPVGSDNPFDFVATSNGASNVLLTTTPTTLLANTLVRVAVEFLPNGTINTSIDGRLTMTTSDNSFPANGFGGISLRSWQTVEMDNIVVRAATGDIGSLGTIGVATNLAAATFFIDGPTVFAGGGTAFSVNAQPGTYTVTFNDVLGYTRPASQTLTLSANSSIQFTGTYQTSAPRTFLVAFTGGKTHPPDCPPRTPCPKTSYPDNYLDGDEGISLLLANIRSQPALAPIQSRAFTFISSENSTFLGSWAPPASQTAGTHNDAKQWLVNSNFAPQDKLIVAGFSYGGNRALAFTKDVYGDTKYGLSKHPTELLVLIDPIDWTRCGIVGDAFSELVNGGCYQENVTHSIPSYVKETLHFHQTQDPKLHGYRVSGNGVASQLVD